MGKFKIATSMVSFIVRWFFSAKKDGKITNNEILDFIEGIIEKIVGLTGIDVNVEITLGSDDLTTSREVFFTSTID